MFKTGNQLVGPFPEPTYTAGSKRLDLFEKGGRVFGNQPLGLSLNVSNGFLQDIGGRTRYPDDRA